MTNKQMAFVNAYMKNGFKGKAAALTAGYSKKSIDKAVYMLLHQNQGIREEIEHRMKKLKERSEWSIEKMRKELTGLYDKTKDRSQIKEALDVLKEINKLLGFYEAQKIDITGIESINININKKSDE